VEMLGQAGLSRSAGEPRNISGRPIGHDDPRFAVQTGSRNYRKLQGANNHARAVESWLPPGVLGPRVSSIAGGAGRIPAADDAWVQQPPVTQYLMTMQQAQQAGQPAPPPPPGFAAEARAPGAEFMYAEPSAASNSIRPSSGLGEDGAV